ncbi:hypothetical protein E7744_05680 [Citricoccus sp. SGAir0253]|uniref:hypothetical protein n=1 Tax=Citricoccus sp. SGAir0253 TaxID=2567881 RepID=UPI0010CD3BA5|nr:hypothetical protein [Citricoccus sp. SGAir0253]QCU77744.1 hypothetical protein E7744_05680 [Citricoccus sp. SGAir0253]
MTRATLAGPWPGADPVAAARDVLAGLARPHLPVLPELPARGPGSDPVGRTAALLDGLAVDLQPHGWRLVPEAGMDHRRAASALRTDVNAFTDLAGERGEAVEELVVRVSGPMSLAAGLWLPGGERSLSDAGARRDVVQSLAAGLADWVRSVRAATGAARLTVVVDEPRAAAVLSGALPTASGYRTVRSIPRSEVRAGWTLVTEAVLDAGATGAVLAPGRAGAEERWGWRDLALLASEALPAVADPEPDAPVDLGLALPLAPLEGPGADPDRWEVTAGWAEAGRTVLLRLPRAGHGAPTAAAGTAAGDRARAGTSAAGRPEAVGTARPYRGTAVGIARTWARIGLDPDLLSALVLGAPDLSGGTRHEANRTLEGAVAAAEDLEHIRQDGGL